MKTNCLTRKDELTPCIAGCTQPKHSSFSGPVIKTGLREPNTTLPGGASSSLGTDSAALTGQTVLWWGWGAICWEA